MSAALPTKSTGFFHSWRYRLVNLGLAAVGALLLFGKASDAHPPYPWSPYSVTLEDDRGNTLRTFGRDGTTFVLGYLGERYNVRLSNHGDRRVEAVLSVDGRDAISGSRGDFVHARGYIVPPHGSVLVDGFRQSLDRAAAFRFSHPASSYSSRMGTPENVGVIGVAFFGEQRPRPRPARPPYTPAPPYDYDARPHASNEPRGRAEKDGASAVPSKPSEEAPRAAPAATAKRSAGSAGDSYRYSDDIGSAPSRLGTEYGESTYSPVTEVPFQRQSSSRPDIVLSLRYDDADGLVARGFDVYPRTEPWYEPARYEPNPFPENHFAEPPP
jgi:hypothetical protein